MDVRLSEEVSGFWGFLGWTPEPYDPQDKLFKADATITLAEKIDLRDAQRHHLWGPIFSQFQFNSCVANAAASLITYEWNMSHAPFVLANSADALPSRVFIWYKARAIDPKFSTYKKKNNGCHNRFAMEGLGKYGACRERFWPYPHNNEQDDMNKPRSSAFSRELDRCYDQPLPPNVCEDGKTHFRIAGYERLDISLNDPVKMEVKESQDTEAMERYGDDLKKNVCQALSELHPVLFDFYYFEGDQPIPSVDGQRVMKSRPLDRRHTPQRKEGEQGSSAERGSHTVLAVGYDKNHVKCLTSDGDTNWPDGCFLMPWDRITDFEATEDFWIVRGFQDV